MVLLHFLQVLIRNAFLENVAQASQKVEHPCFR